MPDERIDRADLEASLRAVQDDLVGRVEQGRRPILGTVGAVIGAGLIIAYLLGRRSGRRRGGIIEIRR